VHNAQVQAAKRVEKKRIRTCAAYAYETVQAFRSFNLTTDEAVAVLVSAAYEILRSVCEGKR